MSVSVSVSVPVPVPVATPAPMPVPSLLPVDPDAQPWSADEPLSIDTPPSVDGPSTEGSLSISALAEQSLSTSPVAEAPPAASLAPCSWCGTIPEPNDLYCAECGRPLPGDTRVIEPIAASAPLPQSAPAPASAVLAAPAVAAVTPAPIAPAAAPPELVAVPTADVESTRIVPRGTGGARFVLQFSTGESYTVLGTGLAGRNPHPEPGEYVDHLVTIVDPGRSVSKTHFEFGQQEGVFWFSDRHSGNGSTIREPGAEPRPCEPGRRYPVVRGTRIDVGEQFVVVS